MNKIKLFSVVYLLFISFFVYLVSAILLDRLSIVGAESFQELALNYALLQTLASVQTSVIIFYPFVFVLLIYYALKMKHHPNEKDDCCLLKKESEKAKKIKYFLLKLFFAFAATSFIALQSFSANLSKGMKALDLFSSSLLSNVSKIELLIEKHELLFQIHSYSTIVAIYLLVFALGFFVRERLFRKKLYKLSGDLKSATDTDVA